MRYLKILSVVLLVVIVAIVAYLVIGFKMFSAVDKSIEPDCALNNYYSKTYNEARERFVEKAFSLSEKYSGVEIDKFSVPSKTDSLLFVDICYIPAQGVNAKLLILTSGIHGVEGFAGSAVQLLFADRFMAERMFDSVGVLLIHALNPYGFKYCRKATENNVDLNRNCMVNTELFNTKNNGFEMLYNLLTPAGKVDVMSLKNQLFPVIAIKSIVTHGMPVLRQAALQGQYYFPEGIYYGGKKYEPQIDSVRQILERVVGIYDTVLNIDLHTGYGEWGRMHLFVNPIGDSVVEAGLKRVFAGETIDWGSGTDFYTINGAYVDMISAMFGGAVVLPMFFEFGTMNSSTTFGSLRSIHTMILENQGFKNGCKSEKDKANVECNMNKLYNPESAAWQSETLRDADKMFDKVFDNFIR